MDDVLPSYALPRQTKPLCCKWLCKYHKTLNKEKKRNFETFVIQEGIKFYGFILLVYLAYLLSSYVLVLLLATKILPQLHFGKKDFFVWNWKMFSYWLVVIIFWLFEFTFLLLLFLQQRTKYLLSDVSCGNVNDRSSC